MHFSYLVVVLFCVWEATATNQFWELASKREIGGYIYDFNSLRNVRFDNVIFGIGNSGITIPVTAQYMTGTIESHEWPHGVFTKVKNDIVVTFLEDSSSYVTFTCNSTNQIIAYKVNTKKPLFDFQITLGSPVICNPLNAPQNYWIQTLKNQAWDRYDGTLRMLSIHEDKTAYGVNANNDIYFQNCANCWSFAWRQIPGKLQQIDSKSADLMVGVSPINEVFQYSRSNGFVKLGNISARWASIGSDGEIWMVSQLNKVYRWGKPKNKRNSDWILVGGNTRGASQISVGNRNNVFLLIGSNDVLHYTPINSFGITIDNWTPLPRTNSVDMMLVSASSNGKLFGNTLRNNLVAWNGTVWESVSSSLNNMKYISISPTGKYFAATNNLDEIYCTYNGSI